MPTNVYGFFSSEGASITITTRTLPFIAYFLVHCLVVETLSLLIISCLITNVHVLTYPSIYNITYDNSQTHGIVICTELIIHFGINLFNCYNNNMYDFEKKWWTNCKQIVNILLTKQKNQLIVGSNILFFFEFI